MSRGSPIQPPSLPPWLRLPRGAGRSIRARTGRAGWLLLAAAGCGGPSSALSTAGEEAARVATLSWWMFAGAGAIWVGVVALAAYALRVAPDRHSEDGVRRWVIAGGTGVTTLVVVALLVWGLTLTADLRPAPDSGALLVEVSGEEFWWRVRYRTPEGDTIDAANEVRLPVGRPVELRLSSPDVIHAFWIPSIAGKMDMIPGRVTRLRVVATRAGRFEGVCAEYCGMAHAKMRFVAVAMEPEAFDRWLAEEELPAALAQADGEAPGGRAAFLRAGCGACHAVRGTRARGTVGPDLTHVGGRETLGAGILPNDAATLEAWIRDPQALKPGVHMPAFGMVAEAERDRMSAWLEALR